MAYRSWWFGGVQLPEGNPTYPIGTPAAAAGGVALPGGRVYDPSGSEDAAMALPYQLVYRCWVFEDSAADLVTTFQQLAGLVRTRGTLQRTAIDSSLTQWCTARLLQMPAERTTRQLLHQPVDLVFEVQTGWRGTARTSSTELDTSPKTIALTNGGNAPVTDLALTLTAGAADVSYLRLDYTGTAGNTSIEWDGLLLASNDLVLQCGVPAIRNNGSDAYANLSYRAAHTLAGWLEIDASSADNLTVYRTITGVGNPTLAISYYDAWL